MVSPSTSRAWRIVTPARSAAISPLTVAEPMRSGPASRSGRSIVPLPGADLEAQRRHRAVQDAVAVEAAGQRQVDALERQRRIDPRELRRPLRSAKPTAKLTRPVAASSPPSASTVAGAPAWPRSKASRAATPSTSRADVSSASWAMIV